MKKSAKLSLAIALMMGVTAGSQIAGMNTASAEISDNFKLGKLQVEIEQKIINKYYQ